MFAFMWGGWVDKNAKKYMLPDNLDRIFVKIVKKDLFRIYGIGKNGVSIVNRVDLVKILIKDRRIGICLRNQN